MPESAQRWRHIMLIGHCGPDEHMLRTTINRILPGAIVTVAHDAAAVRQNLTADALLLVNRVLDQQFEGASGIDLIKEIVTDPRAPVIMLVSNYNDAQDAAVAAGARRGFGKAQLNSDSTAAILRAAAALHEP
jgi:CheY-like chemotaxis protein